MPDAVVVGAGPAGLMAADLLSSAGAAVTIYDAMPSAGRKLLMAGRGGLNLTHSEDLERFLTRYGTARPWLEPIIRAFPPAALVAFAEALGQGTFVGSSGRVFPTAMKASPLLRAWLARLDRQGARLVRGHRLVQVAADLTCTFIDAEGRRSAVPAGAVVLALGGASWPRLGSDGTWRDMVRGWDVPVAPFAAANCGALVAWSDAVRVRHAGTPLKRIALHVGDSEARGEAIITATGLEGGAVYALIPALRRALASGTPASLRVDLRPDMTAEAVAAKLSRPRGKQSLATWLRKTIALPPQATALLREDPAGPLPAAPAALAARIKATHLRATGLAPIDRAISTAGGIPASELDAALMLKRRPGIFVAGEMLDWEAPTGGYLLQACFATGRAAGYGALAYLGCR